MSTLRRLPLIFIAALWAGSLLSPLRAATIGLSFDGPTLTDAGSFPPSPSIGVGPTQVVVAVNGRIRSYNKTTGVADGVLDVSPDTFFASVMTPVGGSVVLNFVSDLHVRYDRLSARWFITTEDVPALNAQVTSFAPNRILIAVSSDSTLTNSTVFTFFQFQADTVNFADDTSLGIDANALYIGANILTPAYVFAGTNGYVVQKSSVLGTGPIVVTTFGLVTSATGVGPLSPRGVDNDDPTATEGYFVGSDNATFSKIMFRRVSDPGSTTPTISANIPVTVPTTTFPNPVDHPGNSGGNNGRLSTLDDRLFAAQIRNGRLWTAHNFRVSATGVANTAAAARNASRWYEFQNLTATPALRQSGTVFDNAATLAASRHYFIPTVAVTGQGHAVLGCTMAGTPIGATPVFVSRFAGDTLGTMTAPPTTAAVTFGATTANYNPASDPGGTNGRRWGNYSATVLDSSDDMTIWTIQEYNNALNSWGVKVVRLLAPPPAAPASCDRSVTAGSSSVNVVVTGTSSSGSGFYDGGSSFANHVAASVSGTGVTVNSVSYTDSTHVTLNLAVAANAAAGTRSITITNPDGQSVTSASAILTIDASPAPTITSIAPTSGPAAGGTSVVIAGTNFANVTAVSFGATAATSFTVDSSTQIAATAPAHAAGLVDVTVTTASGTSATSSADEFTYQAPPPEPHATATLTAAIPDHANGGKALPGDVISYTAKITNTGTAALPNLVFDAAPDANTTLVTSSINVSPWTIDNTAATTSGAPITITLLADDADHDPLQFTIVDPPAHGTLGAVVVISPLQSRVTYTPPANYTGTDSFTFQVSDGRVAANEPGTVTISIAALTASSAPTDVQASAGNGQATLTFSAPASTGGSAITGYTATASPGGLTGTSNGAETSIVIGGLTNGTSYTFTVTATNGVGVSAPSVASNAVTPVAPTSAPDAPTNVVGTAGNGQVTLTFSAPADTGGSAITGYTATSSPSGLIGVSNGAGTSIVVNGLTNGISYTFTVTATNAVGESTPSSPSNAVTPATVSSAPTNVVGTAGNGQVTLTFGAPTTNGGSAITGYTATSSPGGVLGVSNGASTSIVVNGLTNGISYTFTVTATNGSGVSAPSSPSNAVTPATVSSAPTNVVGTAGNGQVTLTFGAPSTNGGSAITGYTATSSPGGVLGVSNGAGTTIVVNGLTNGISYTFTVTATNGSGVSAPSSPSNAVTPATVSSAPTNVVSTAGNGQVTLTFGVPSTNGGSAITGYTATSSPGGVLGVSNGAGTTIVVNGLTNGISYTFTVTATNGSGASAPSSPSNAVTPVAPTSAPDAPTSVVATAGNQNATLSFSAPANDGGSAITGYTATSSPGGLTGTSSGSSTSIGVSGLTIGTSYTFTVTATNAIGTSAASAASNAVTAIGVSSAPVNVFATRGNGQVTLDFTAPTVTNGSAITGYTATSTPGGFTATSVGATPSIVFPDLTNGISFTFTVTATNGAGTSAPSSPSNAVTPATVPSKPANVQATAGNGQVTLTFGVPATSGGSAITGYTATSSPGGVLGVSNGASTSIVVNGLTNGISYTFTVTATNAAGTSAASIASDAVTPVNVPSAPTSVSGVAGNGQVTLSFTAPADDGGSAITGYTAISSPGGVFGVSNGASTSIVVNGLTNGINYTFTVTATNGAGVSAPSSPTNAVTPRTVSSAPRSVVATVGNGSVALSFTAPATTGGSAVTGYTATSSPGGVFGVSNGASTSIVVNGLTNGISYTFTVTATNAAGVSAPSAASNAVTPAAPASAPDAPTNLAAVAGNQNATLSFSAPASDGGSAITGYTATSSPGGLTGTSSGSTTNIVVSGLTVGTSYTFTVTATNTIGTSAASVASNAITAITVSSAPVNVFATGGNGQVTLDFTAPTVNNGSAITGYTATSSPGGAIGVSNGAGTTIVVNGLTNGISYTFIVTATNGAGVSAPASPSNAATPATVPSKPANVQATAGNGQVTLTFGAPATNGGSAITGYTATSSPGGITGVSNGSSTTIVVNGLTNGVSYTFTVTAANAVGTSAASLASNAVTPVNVPGAPTNVSGVAGNGQVTLSFTAPADDGGSAITGYTATSSPGGVLGVSNGASTTIVVNGLTNGISYTFTVTATNAAGVSAPSSPTNAVTPRPVSSAPRSVVATAGDGAASLSFTAPATTGGSAITGYTATSSPDGITGTSVGNATTIEVAGLTNGTSYTFTVTATNAAGVSAPSEASNAVTPVPTATAPGVPTNVVATRGNGQASLTFSAPASDGGSAITGYTATASPGGATGTSNGAATSIVVLGLTNGTSYTFTVTATNGVGVSAASAPSSAVTPLSVPSAPAIVSATAGNGSVTLTFTAPSDDGGSAITSYTATSSPGGNTASAVGSATSIVVGGLVNGTSYTFTIKATNGAGLSAPSSPSNAVTPAAPCTATSLPPPVQAAGATTPNSGGNRIVIYFTAPADTSQVENYVVELCDADGVAVSGVARKTIAVSSASTFFTQNAQTLFPECCVLYRAKVWSTNCLGDSAAVMTNRATLRCDGDTCDAATAPTNVVAVAGDGQVTLNFTAPTGGSPVTEYTATSSPGGVTALSSGAATSIVVPGLTNGVSYTFTVKTTSAGGTSAASAPSNAVTPATVPGAPTNVQATCSSLAVQTSSVVASAAATPQPTIVCLYGAAAGVRAASPQDAAGSPAPLTEAQLTGPVAEAIARWEATGLTAAQRAILQGLHWSVDELGEVDLAMVTGHDVVLNATAGGFGWFVDPALTSDAAFAGGEHSGTRYYTDPAGAAAGHMDLLTAIMHEMGHALGLKDSLESAGRDSVMYGYLTLGERRVPAPGEAAAAVPSTDGHTDHLQSALTTLSTLPVGKSVTVTFQATIANPVSGGAGAISLQGTVTADNLTSVLTDDPTVTGTENPTVVTLASTDARLAGLTLSAGTLAPSFAGGVTSYTASVGNATTSLTLTPTSADSTATIKVNDVAVASGATSGAINLAVGANTLTTVVTAQDGTTTATYTVVVTRAPSANAALSALSLSKGTLSPTFASGTTSYTASVANSATSLTVTPTAADATATVTVNGVGVTSGNATGSIALLIGANTLTTVVTAQDGTTTQTYTVVVTRAAALPSVTSPTSADLTTASATLGGTVASDGGGEISERGVVLAKTSVNAAPTLGGTGVSKLAGTGTTGAFTVEATGLSAGLGYSFAAYATNSAGTGYSSAATFTTVAGPAILVEQPAATVLTAGFAVNAYGPVFAGAALTPPPFTSFRMIAPGGQHALVLKDDGTIVAWGDNSQGQITVPPGLTGVVSVGAGGAHSLAVKSDGTVVAWGLNHLGQAFVPPGLTGVVAVAGGSAHSVALKSDGTVVAWGDNSFGQISVPAGLSGVVAIAANNATSMALKSDGTVVAWGGDGNGPATAPEELSGVVAIAAGSLHRLALKSDGTLVAWGDNSQGQTTIPAGLTDVVAIAASGFHNLALKRDGTIVQWGGPFAELNAASSLTDVRVIAAGDVFNVVVQNVFPLVRFAPTAVGASDTVKTFTVRNTGGTTLTLGAITKSGAGAADFTVSAPGSTSLAAGASTTFTVTFAPLTGGARDARIALPSNDPAVSPSTIQLSGIGVSTVLGTSTLIEGPAAGSDTVLFAVQPFDYALAWTAVANDAWLHVAGGSASGAGSAAILFTFDANTGATRTGTLTIGGRTLTVTQAGSTYVAAANASGIIATAPGYAPGELATNAAGDLFTFEGSPNFAIKKWTKSTGQIGTLATGGPGLGLAADSAGNVFYANGQAIKQVAAVNQQVSTIVAGLNFPVAVAVDAADDLYILDLGARSVLKFTRATQQLSTLVSTGLTSPQSLAVDVAGNVYIADGTAVVKWTASTRVAAPLLSLGAEQAFRLAVDGGGNLFLETNLGHKLWTAATGQLSALQMPAPAPLTVVVDATGTAYYADYAASGIRAQRRAFVDTAPISVGPAAGGGALPVVLPADQLLTGAFAPTSTASWLTVGAVTNGVVNYSYAANTTAGAPRQAGIFVLGTPVTITQGGPSPLVINDVALAEGNAGTTAFTFTVQLLTPAPVGGITFDIATADGTATAGSDYVAKTLTGQTIPASASTYSFTVLVNGDTVFEPHETFFVNVTNLVNAAAFDAQGQGTISNDDLPQADLSITVTDGVTTATPGGTLTYTIVASNAGPDSAAAALVADVFPAALTNVTWTAIGAGGGAALAASGSGNLSESVDLPAGGSVTFTVTGTLGAGVTGTLSNTATISAPDGVIDPAARNNSATDTDTLTPQANLGVTLTDGVAIALPGGTVTYTLTASNAGPSNISGATLADTFPAALTGVFWTGMGAGGGAVTATGTGNIDTSVTLPAGGSVILTVTATVSASATGSLANTATIAAPDGVTDPTPGNNSATDTDTLAQAPVVTTSGGTTAANERIATPVDPALIVTDGDSATLASATVSITGNFATAEDALSFTNDGSTMGDLVASYDSTTGVLTLTSAGATATLVQWQAALRAVGYTDTSHTPSTATRTIRFVVNDGALGSNLATKLVSVTAVNEAPTLTSVSPLTGATEDTSFTIAYADLAAAANAADLDGDVLSFRIAAVSTGMLAKDGVPVTAGVTTLGVGESLVWTPTLAANGTLNAFTVVAYDGALASATPVQVTVTVAAVNDTPTLDAIANPAAIHEDAGAQTINLSGISAGGGESQTLTVTATSDNTALIPNPVVTYTSPNATGSLAYTPVANANGTATITITVQDSGGTANGAFDTLTRTFTIDVTPVNDAPTLNAITTLTGATEDTAFTITYAALLAASNAADIEGDAISFRVAAISSGTLTKGGAAVVAGTTRLAAGESLMWTPALDAHGTIPAFAVVAFDGALASPTAVTANVAVASANDAPTDLALSSATVTQSSSNNAIVGTLATTDADSDDTFTYTLVTGTGSTDNASFNISGDKLRAAAPSSLVPRDYTVRVRTTDASLATFEKAFTITVSDNVAPTVVSVSGPASGTYGISTSLDFTVTFSEPVTVDPTGGTPTLALTLAGNAVDATYLTGSGTAALVFRYTVKAGDHAADGEVLLGALALNGATIRDTSANDAHLVFAPPAQSGVLVEARFHSADTNRDWAIDLSELLRVIELYNTKSGTTRTGAYHTATTTTEDGYEAGPGTITGPYHSADSNHDGAIDLGELTRAIELYNARSVATRTGIYHRAAGTEDGFAPGPDKS